MNSRDRGLLLAALAASILFGFGSYVTPPLPGLDASYNYAHNHASVRGLVWGREFVSTCGPFGYVLFPLALDGIPARWLAFQFALVIGVAAVAWAYVRTAASNRSWAAWPAVVGVVYAIHVQEPEQRWFGLLLVLSLLARGAAGRMVFGLLGLTGFLAGFLVLVKVSLGFGAVLTALACAVIAPGWRAAWTRGTSVAAGVAAGVCAGWCVHYRSLAGLWRHVEVAASAASGYSSAMSLATEETGVVVACSLISALLLGAWVLAWRDREFAARWLICLVPLAVAWKHSVVRLDRVHIRVFPCLALLVGTLLFVAAPRGATTSRRVLSLLGAALLLVPAFGSWAYWDARHPMGRSADSGLVATLLAPLELPGLRGLRLALRPTAAGEEWARQSSAGFARAVLPEPTRAMIGQAGVDVYPWEASCVVASGLNWQLRPSTASFATYTPTLDRMNASFFASPARPPFLLWHTLSSGIDSIDGRYLLWDEPATIAGILGGYDLVEYRTRFLLLRARSAPRWRQRAALGTASVAWSTPVAVPRAEGVVLAEVHLHRPPLAAARRVLFREEPAYISVTFENGARATYRFVPDQAATGLWINPFPWRDGDLAALLRGEALPRVTSIAFDGGWGAPTAPPLDIQWWEWR